MFFFKTVITDLQTEEETAHFLDSLLTNTEKLLLAKRLAMVILIKEGASETQIVETLKTTYATVEKMKLMLDKKIGGYQIGLEKLEQRPDWKKLRKNLLELVG